VSQEGLPRRHIRFGDRRGLDAWSLLLTFFSLMGAAVAVVLGPVNLSNDELLVLICLAHAGGDVSMGQLERSTLLRAARLRRVVDKLETRRLAAWRRSRADRRKVLVRMTKAGRQLTESVSPEMFDLVRGVTEPLGVASTEFMRAKMRKILSRAAVDAVIDLEGMYADHRYGSLPLAPEVAAKPAARSVQRPLTWGLAGWLRCCQWSHHVERLWKREFRNSGFTMPRLQILAALSGAADAMTADAVASASATGLPQAVVTSTLSALEQAGLVIESRDEAQPRATVWRLTQRGEQKVLEALPMANRLAEDLYQGVSDQDLARVLSLLPKLCSSAWQVRHYGAAPLLASSTSGQQATKP
jgi:DNA-binding MarR family transcriptional regulator